MHRRGSRARRDHRAVAEGAHRAGGYASRPPGARDPAPSRRGGCRDRGHGRRRVTAQARISSRPRRGPHPRPERLQQSRAQGTLRVTRHALPAGCHRGGHRHETRRDIPQRWTDVRHHPHRGGGHPPRSPAPEQHTRRRRRQRP